MITLPPNFNYDKKALIDYVFIRSSPSPRSFADLGGVWGIEGAYTFYTLDNYKPEQAYLVDTNYTDAVKDMKERYQSLSLLCGNFGSGDIFSHVPCVDAIFLFDVLLHQVKPDWYQILQMYAEKTRYFIIYNQQWIGSPVTVRLLDLGREEYFKNIPHTPDHPTYKQLFEKMYEIHPFHNKMWRDIHNVWQWGITDKDLMNVMESLRFKLLYFMNYGQFGSLVNIENHGFIFKKI